MRRQGIRLACLALAVLVAGCAAQPPLPTPGAAPDWPARRAALQSLAQWQVTGRVAVAAPAAGEGFSAALEWRRAGPRNELVLRGPLGVGGVRLTLEGGSVEVDDGRGEARRYTDLEAGLAAGVGVALPVEALQYWVLGVPAPGREAVEHAGPGASLAALDQDGWRVQFDRYAATALGPLPGRVAAERAGVRVRLLLQDWQVGPGAGP